MSDKAYSNAEFLNLQEFFPKGCLRTITADLNGIKGTANEMQLVIELARESVLSEKERPVVFRDAMYIHGFVKIGVAIKNIFQTPENIKNGKISFYEWDDKFLVIFAAGEEFKEQSYYMSKEDFKMFFYDGLHPNSEW